MIYQRLVSDYPDLFEDIYALLDAHVYPPLVVKQFCEVVSIKNFLLDNFQGSAH